MAQKKTATIGGSVFVGPTTKLKEPLSSSEDDAHYRPHKDRYNYIRVEHGQLSEGDIIQMEARGHVEFTRVISDRTELESPQGDDPLEIGSGLYRYEVERDLDGTGANTWKEGDAVASTGQEGSGFIDLYPQRSKRAENETGPSIAISVRAEDASTWTGAEDEYYKEWGERSALGNLDGLYDFTGDVYGVAGGRYEDAWFSVDENQGFRLMNEDTMVGQWATDGTVRVGPHRADIGTHPLVIQPDGTLTTYGDLRLPDGDGGYQRPANWQGPWMAGVSYDKGDAVSYQGQTYICVTAHTSSTTDGQNATGEPDDSDYWEAMAEAAEQAYISTPSDSAIKNSTSNLEVKAQLITGPEEKTLSDTSGYTFVDEDGTDISTYATQVTSGELHYELTPSDIGSSLTVHLEDPDGNQVGTTTLIDITESIIGTTTVISGDRSYYRPPGGAWETGETQFEAEFIQGSSVVATAEAHVSWDGATFTLEKDPTGSNPGSITVTGTDEGNAYTLRFEYTNPSGITQHTETTVLAIEGGTDSQLVRLEADSRVFTQKKDGSHDPSSITLEAHQQNIPGASFTWKDGNGDPLGTGSTLTVDHSELSGGSLEVTLEEDGTGLTDTTTLVEVVEGTDAITVVVDNQSHTFPAESDGEVTDYGGGDATVEVYEGATKLTQGTGDGSFSVNHTPSDLNGDSTDDITGTVTAGTNSWTFTPDSMQTAVQRATVDLAVNVVRSDGSTVTHNHQLTYTKAKVAQGMRLSADSQILRLNKDGSVDNSPITLTAAKQNVTEAVNWSSSNTTFASKNGNEATISYAEFEGAGTGVTSTTVTAEAGGFSDEVTLSVVEEGIGVDGSGFDEPGLEGVGGDGGDEPGRPSWRSAGAAWDLPEEMSLDEGAGSTAGRAARGEPHEGLTGPQNRRAIF